MTMERTLSLNTGFKPINEDRVKCGFKLNCACEPSATEMREFRKVNDNSGHLRGKELELMLM